MSHPTLISIIVPVYNGARYLRAAVENIRAQNHSFLEIIIVDDASTDDSARIAAALATEANDVRCVRHETNLGPAAARNAALEIARGEIIGFLDVDDEWPPDSFQARLDCLLQNPDLEIVLGKVQCLRESAPTAEISESTPAGASPRELSVPFVSFNLGAALYRKSVFEKIGGFNPTLRYGEDTDWFMRARENGVRLLVLPQTGLFYRLHEGGMTHGRSPSEMNMTRMLKLSLDRRRQRQERASDLPALPGMTQEELTTKNLIESLEFTSE